MRTYFTLPDALRPSRLRTRLHALSNLIVPPICLTCSVSLADHHALCPACWRDITFIRTPVCERLGIPLPFNVGRQGVSAAALADPPHFDRARAAAHYAGTIRKLLHDFKYADRQDLSVLLSTWMMAAGHELLSDAHVILPVPMSRRRLFWRSFNQAALLAQQLGRRTGLPVDTSTLRRRKATRPQVGLTRAQRQTNLEGAFAVLKRRHDLIAGRNVLLIDDVITTGATANACAKSLKRAGATRVDVLTLALVAGETPIVP